MWYDARGGLDLEGFGLPDVHAHRRGEALDRRVPRAADLPVAGRVPRQGVLAGDHAGHRRTTRASRSGRPHIDEKAGQAQEHRQHEADDRASRRTRRRTSPVTDMLVPPRAAMSSIIS